jgi:DNA-binding transcriptional LysR family regulator
VRAELPVNLARDVVIPRLPELLAAHPHLEILLGTSDRRVDVVREGFDFVVRIGVLADSSLVARRLGVHAMANYASAAYLAKHGVPEALSDLDAHVVVHYSHALGGKPSFEYLEGHRWVERPMRALVTVNNADAYEAACLAGLGIIQAPRWHRRDALLEHGALLEILPEHTCQPMPVTMLHPPGRAVPKRVRAVMSWIAGVVEGVFSGTMAR